MSHIYIEVSHKVKLKSIRPLCALVHHVHFSTYRGIVTEMRLTIDGSQ